MNKFKILLPLTAGLILLLSCSGSPDETETSAASSTETSADTGITITFMSGDTAYTLVRPEYDMGFLEAAQVIHQGAAAKDIKIEFTTDFAKNDEAINADPHEILVGETNRPQSAEAYSMIGDEEVILAVIDGKLVVAGSTHDLTTVAAEKLCTYLTEDGLTLPDDFCEIYTAEPTVVNKEITNPVHDGGGDPWIIRDGDAYYYCYSGGDGVCVNQISGLDNITQEGGKKVYTAPAGTMYSREYWAPELHKIGDEWYIYVAADDGDNYNHRMYVLRCRGDKPTDEFEMVGKITDSTDKWAIDGTVLQYKDELYFIWSGWEGDENVAQNLYIAHMSNPWTIDSERVLLSEPEFTWEKLGGRPTINEGPATVVKDDTAHIIYSGSGSWSDHYCLGKLTFRGGDILDPECWEKSEESVFQKTDKVFGPGHCSFTTAEDGSTWIVYHANLVSGSGWSGRSIWTQPVAWDGDELILGEPVEPDAVLRVPTVSYSLDGLTMKTN